MNYEAKINGMWYPVNIDGYHSHTFRGHKFDSVCVSVKWHKIPNGRRNQELPFYSPSMGGPVYLSSGSVSPRDIRETTDDPLETIYPKTK